MAAARWFRYAYLARLSRPKAARQLFHLIKRQHVVRIVEIGISDTSRTQALIEVAQRYAGDQKVFHTGLDWFDARPAHVASLTLKEAYRVLHATGASVRLVPGCPGKSLGAVANAHQNTDLVLISSLVADEELKAAWFYIPRMLHEDSILFRERQGPEGEPAFERLMRSQVAEWAGQTGIRRAA